MRDYLFISDYRQNETCRESFNQLAMQVFQLDFRTWYNKGFWTDDYICHSYMDKDRIIANASINRMVVTANGKEYQALQIGTVMTHPDYRQQGLSAKLMHHIIDQYEGEYDFLYLFANDTVLDFYPKFGFEKVQESHFFLNTAELAKHARQKSALRKLDGSNEADLALMQEFAHERIPVSTRLGIKNNPSLLMFYFLLAFPDEVYYVEEEDVIVLFSQTDHQLNVFDIISKRPFDVEQVVSHLIHAQTNSIQFHFMPDSNNHNMVSARITKPHDTLFVRPFLFDDQQPILFPLTSHA